MNKNQKIILLVSVVVLIGIVSFIFMGDEPVENIDKTTFQNGSFMPIPLVADNDYKGDLKTYTSEFGFSFDYPSQLEVNVDPDSKDQKIIITPVGLKKEDGARSIVIDIFKSDKKITAEEWLLSPVSGFNSSVARYHKAVIDDMVAVYVQGGMWVLVNTPDYEYRLSIMNSPDKDGNALVDEMGAILESMKFVRS